MKYFEDEDFQQVQDEMLKKYNPAENGLLKIHHTKYGSLELSVIEFNGFFRFEGVKKITPLQEIMIAKQIKKLLQEVPNE